MCRLSGGCAALRRERLEGSNLSLLDQNCSLPEPAESMIGQQPSISKATKSVAGFKIREGMSIGASVTLRQEQMYNFLTKLINIVLPRIRDFRGISPNSFDGRGNYNLGLKEQLIFPEVSYDDVTQIRGLDISIVTTAKTDEEARALLKAFGMPFATL